MSFGGSTSRNMFVIAIATIDMSVSIYALSDGKRNNNKSVLERHRRSAAARISAGHLPCIEVARPYEIASLGVD